MALDLELLKQSIGQRELDVDYVTIPAVHRLAATLDRDDPVPKMGDPLPIGWHFLLFPRVVRQSEIGLDGHPKGGEFMPPVPLPRRMFASRRTTVVSELRIGDEVHRESTIKDITMKVRRPPDRLVRRACRRRQEGEAVGDGCGWCGGALRRSGVPVKPLGFIIHRSSFIVQA